MSAALLKAKKPLAVLDTNIWLLLGRRKWDIHAVLVKEGFEPILLAAVHKELEKLSLKRSQTALSARLALQFIKQKGLKTILSSDGYADTAIADYCLAKHCAAVTQDASLRRELRRLRIPIVTIHRSGKVTTEETHVLQTQSTRSHSRTTR